jgi:hypothetical protein
MATRTRAKKTEAVVPEDYGRGIMLAASLLESLGTMPLAGGVHGGLPTARRFGQDSPAIITEAQLQTYRGIARWAYERNEYYGGIIDNAVVNYVAGRGFTWTVAKRGWTPDPNLPPVPAIKLAQDTLDDFRHLDGWRSRQREEIRRVYRDGESLRRIFAPLRLDDLPQVRFVEPEHVTCPPGYGSAREWSFGVLALRHDQERHLAYYVQSDPEEPGEVVLAAGVSWGEIPGDYLVGLRRGPGCIVHRKEGRCDRAVKRGLPLFWGGTDGLEQAESLLDNMTGVAAYLSTIAYFRQHAPGVTGSAIENLGQRLLARQQTKLEGPSTAPPNTLPVLAGLGGFLAGWRGLGDPSNTLLGLGPTVKDITAGMQVQPPPVSGNVVGFLAVLQARIRAACVLIGAPEHLGSGDASNNNYASIKEAGAPFVVATEGRQQDCADGDQRVAEVVLRYAGADFPGCRVNVTPPDVAMKSDDEKERIIDSKVKGKRMSPQEAIRQSGGDVKQTMAEIKAWEDEFPDEGPGLTVPDIFGTGGARAPAAA